MSVLEGGGPIVITILAFILYRIIVNVSKHDD